MSPIHGSFDPSTKLRLLRNYSSIWNSEMQFLSVHQSLFRFFSAIVNKSTISKLLVLFTSYSEFTFSRLFNRMGMTEIEHA